jgi:hypothetical protein
MIYRGNRGVQTPCGSVGIYVCCTSDWWGCDPEPVEVLHADFTCVLFRVLVLNSYSDSLLFLNLVFHNTNSNSFRGAFIFVLRTVYYTRNWVRYRAV